MALRSLAFGIRLRDRKRTVRVRSSSDGKSYVVEDSNGKEKKTRKHNSAQSAVKDAASTWRGRLH